jgi:hypothetical protein
LSFGKVAHGTVQTETLRTSVTNNGRLIGKPRGFDPPLDGLLVEGNVDGSAGEMRVTANTSVLEAGKHYSTSLILETNVGSLRVPVELHTTLRWNVVVGWTASLGLAVALGMWLCRLLLANAHPVLTQWFLSFQNAPMQVMIASGALGALVAGTLALLITLKVRKMKAEKT